MSKKTSLLNILLLILFIFSVVHLHTTWQDFAYGKVSVSENISDELFPDDGSNDSNGSSTQINESENEIINRGSNVNIEQLDTSNFFALKEPEPTPPPVVEEPEPDPEPEPVEEPSVAEPEPEPEKEIVYEVEEPEPPTHYFTLQAVSGDRTRKKAIIMHRRQNKTYIVEKGDTVDGFKVEVIYKEEMIISKDGFWLTIKYDN
ncbi:MAG: hypothetical protein ACOCRL_02085 [Bacillota bacterium]